MGFLAEPSMQYRESYLAMVDEWLSAKEKFIPSFIKVDCSDFSKMVTCLRNQSQGFDLKDGMVRCSSFWLIEDDLVIGVVNIRHYLTPQLEKLGGHIGYGIRPSQRLKGHGTEILRQGLKKAKELGIDIALITCDTDNLGSVKVIENNGGVIDSTGEVNGVPISRYLIKIE